MNIRTAQNGYGTAQRNVGTPRSVEASVLGRITRTLIAAAQDRDTSYAAYVDALQANSDLWRIFARDLSSPENALPMDLRKQLFALAGFVHDETSRILVSGAGVENLSAINMDILSGLSAVQPAQVAT